jgi:DNA-binding NtrC family response regulator
MTTMPKRIFIFEDDEATRYVYEKALTTAGYQTAGFGTYFAAGREMDAGAGALLVVDLRLPTGTPQGMSIARMARFRRPKLPIIFVSGYPEMAAMAHSEIGPVMPIMFKPVDLGFLVSTVRELLAGSTVTRI